jgi:hypothetical protein
VAPRPPVDRLEVLPGLKIAPRRQECAFLFFQKFFATVDVGRWGCGDGKVQELFGPALWALSCRLVCGKKVGKLHLESPVFERTGVRHVANTIEEMQKLLLGYRDNMRVEVETGIAVTAKTVADLRALSAWPDGLVLNIHVDLDPRFSVVRVQQAS